MNPLEIRSMEVVWGRLGYYHECTQVFWNNHVVRKYVNPSSDHEIWLWLGPHARFYTVSRSVIRGEDVDEHQRGKELPLTPLGL